MEGSWTATVCNATLFHLTFTFDETVAKEALQQVLCETAPSDEVYMKEILDSVETDKLLVEVRTDLK